jgi:NADH dehydrogenase
MLSLVRHAREAGVGHFVYLSFPRSDLNYIFQGVKRKVEAELQRRDRASMSYTIIRSAPFMEVWLSPFLGFDPLAGRVEVLGDGTRPISWISIQDVARFAAAASEGGPFANRVLEVGGPEALSYLDVLKAFTAVVGRPVVPVFTDVGELESAFARSTEPKGQALAAARLITARGTTVDGRAAQALLPGRLVAISDYARSFGGAARSGQGGSQ